MASRKPLVISGGQVQQIPAGDTLGARATVNGSTSPATTTSASMVVMPDMTLSFTTIGGLLDVRFDMTVQTLTLDSMQFAIFLDGAEVPGTRRSTRANLSISLGILTLDNFQPGGCHAQLAPAAGAHTVDVRWLALAGTARCKDTERKLSIVEYW